MSRYPKSQGEAFADRIDRIMARAVREGRNLALDAAISICDDCVKSGDSAETCLQMLRDMKGMLNPKMDS